jgi:signal transduction histidine kinase
VTDDARLRIIRGVALATGVTLAWLEWQASPNADRAVLALDVAVGLTFVGAAVITLGVPTARRFAYLELAAGIAWYAGAVAPIASGAYLGFLLHLLATYPIGRIERTFQRAVVAAGYVLALIAPPLGLAGVEPALLAVVAATSLVNASTAAGPLRRGRMGATLVAATIAVVFALVAAGVAGGTIDFATARILSATVLIVATATLAIDLRWGGWSRDALTRLVIDLGDRAQATTLRDRLAAALDDPTLVIGYGLGEGGTYVDDDGRPVEPPAPGSGRIAVPLRSAGRDVGVLVRDERWPIDPILADGVAAAAELALGNARLHAATRRQTADLEASRERLIDAAEAERQRIRRELDGGAMRRIAMVREALAASVALGPEREPLLEHASAVMRQLAELSGGLGPASALVDGLGPALVRLAADSSVPAVADGPVGRLPPLVEATAFYVCSEGLANVAKHARASRVSIRAHERNGTLFVEVVDDGIGDATPSPGSGLDGLRQRVETTGGQLTIEDRREGGTRLLAKLPIDRRAGLGRAMDPAGRTAWR